MTFPVQVGAPSITINRDDRFLVCQPDGRILGAADDGFFSRDTRFISGYELRINGRRPQLLNSAPIQFFSARFEYTNVAILDDEGTIDRQSLSIRVDRTISEGVHEDVDVINYARRPVRLTIEVAIDSDFTDIFEVRGDRAVRRGQLNTRWLRSRAELRTAYTNGHFRRELLVEVENNDSPVQYANGRLVFVATIAPKGVWHTCLKWLPLIGDGKAAAARRRPTTLPCNSVEMRHPGGRPNLPKVAVETPNATVARAWEQAVRDLDALRLEDSTFERGVYVPAAGVP